MRCPQCHSSNLRKDGRQNGKQRFECKDCGRLFRDSYEAKGYHPQVKKICLEMYLNSHQQLHDVRHRCRLLKQL